MRKALGIILFFLFSLMAFGDIIYLSDGTKLSGKILSYLGDEVEVLLETGSSLRLKTNQIIRIEPLDTVLLSTSNASMESNSAPITTVPGQWGQGYSVTG
ncbi:MAG TPA: hypothetical protein PLF98_03380, partial [Thermotogota bacterium]|nr:hypothetical protein [Thermotogota bacterium]